MWALNSYEKMSTASRTFGAKPLYNAGMGSEGMFLTTGTGRTTTHVGLQRSIDISHVRNSWFKTSFKSSEPSREVKLQEMCHAIKTEERKPSKCVYNNLISIASSSQKPSKEVFGFMVVQVQALAIHSWYLWLSFSLVCLNDVAEKAKMGRKTSAWDATRGCWNAAFPQNPTPSHSIYQAEKKAMLDREKDSCSVCRQTRNASRS